MYYANFYIVFVTYCHVSFKSSLYGTNIFSCELISPFFRLDQLLLRNNKVLQPFLFNFEIVEIVFFFISTVSLSTAEFRIDIFQFFICWFVIMSRG